MRALQRWRNGCNWCSGVDARGTTALAALAVSTVVAAAFANTLHAQVVTSDSGSRASAVASAVVSASTASSPSANAMTVQDAIALALKQGPGARSVSKTREAADWRNRAFNASRKPQLSLRSDLPIYRREIVSVVQPDGSQLFLAQEQRQSTLSLQMSQLLPFSGGDLYISTALSNVNTVGAQETRLWRSTPFQVGLRQQLFKPNTLKWDNQEQDLRLEVSDRQYLEARENLAQQTASLFFEVFSTRTALQNAVANASINDTLFTLNKGRYEVGRIGENDLLQSELALLRARNRLDAATLAAERSAASLRLQLGLASSAPLELKVTNDIPVLAIDTTVAVREALRNGAQIRELELQDVQQRRRVNEASRNSAFSATVNAAVGYNQSAQTFGDAYNAPLQSQNISVGIEMPVLQWGARRAQINAARADQERVATDSKVAREQRAQDAIYAARGVDLAARQLALAAKGDSVGAKRFEVAYNRYSIGKIDIGNLFIAQGEKDQALEGYVDALRGYWDAWYRLRRLTLYDFQRNERIQ